MPRSEICAVAALVVALVIVASLRRILPIDEIVYQWLQFHRSCAVEHTARWIDPLVRWTLTVLIGVALVGGGLRHPWYVLGLAAIFLGGAAATELAKTAIERLRPNAIPGMVSGNSFPSGHTTGAAMAGTIAILLIRARNWRPAIRRSGYAAAVLSVVAQGAGRLLHGSHWLSDVTVSMLLGSAWVLGAERLRRLPRVAAATLVAAALVAFLVFDDVPGTRFRLPSAIDEPRSYLASIEFGTPESHALLTGKWEDGPAEPIGPVSWARSSDVAVELRRLDQPAGIVKVTLRPPAGGGRQRTCSRVVISVNDWVAPEIFLTRGWREYHLEPPAGVLRPGDNTVRFHIITDRDSGGAETANGLAAFRYLRLYPRS